MKIRVEKGRKVVMEYRVKLPSGKLVDSSDKAGGPVAFICGRGDFPEPVEEAVVGLLPGDVKIIPVPPRYTYGEYEPTKVQLVAMERVTDPPEVGKVVKAPDPFGLRRPAIVLSVWHGAILLDFNHPLAGKTLQFEVLIKEVAPAEAKEME